MQWLPTSTTLICIWMDSYYNLFSLNVTLMQIWKSANIFVFHINAFSFHINAPLTLQDMPSWYMWKFCLQTFRNNRICKKLAYVLRNLQTSQVYNSRSLKIKNANFSAYCFYMSTNIKGDFQICVSVPLIHLMSLFPSYTHWKHKKPETFWCF